MKLALTLNMQSVEDAQALHKIAAHGDLCACDGHAIEVEFALCEAGSSRYHPRFLSPPQAPLLPPSSTHSNLRLALLAG